MDHELGAAHIAAADERIADAEARLARMRELLVEMERDGHPNAVAQGRELVASCERNLVLLHERRAFWAQLHETGSAAAESPTAAGLLNMESCSE